MSAQELRFKNEFEIEGQPRVNNFKINPISNADKHIVRIDNGKTRGEDGRKNASFILDRNQAHLLMLYLQEQIK